LQLSSILGVSIGAAIVASHPDNLIDYFQSFWKDLTVFHSKLLPVQVERLFSYFGALFDRLDRLGSMFEKPPRVRLPRASQRFPSTQGS
jgi:hypothetical protein